MEYFNQQQRIMRPNFMKQSAMGKSMFLQTMELNTTNSPVAESRPNSLHIKPQDLSALKERVHSRKNTGKYNKENNSLAKSTIIQRNKTKAKSFFSRSEPEPKKKDLCLDDFQIGDLLGKGAQAKVRFAVHKETGFAVSIKTINREKIQEKLDIFIRALKIQLYLDHSNVAKIYGMIVEKNNVHIIMQYCADGSLADNRQQFAKQNNFVKQVLFQVAKGVQYLHEKKIQHRDLKLQNILMCYGIPKITDFQLSVYTRLPFLLRRTICGSPAYFSPEMIEKHRYNKKADIWCLGIIFYETLCGYFPFELNKMQDLSNIFKDFKEFPNTLSKQAIEIISKMLNRNCEERVDIDDITEHSFFKGQRQASEHFSFQ